MSGLIYLFLRTLKELDKRVSQVGHSSVDEICKSTSISVIAGSYRVIADEATTFHRLAKYIYLLTLRCPRLDQSQSGSSSVYRIAATRTPCMIRAIYQRSIGGPKNSPTCRENPCTLVFSGANRGINELAKNKKKIKTKGTRRYGINWWIIAVSGGKCNESASISPTNSTGESGSSLAIHPLTVHPTTM